MSVTDRVRKFRAALIEAFPEESERKLNALADALDEILQEVIDDLDDRINKRGSYDPHF